MVALSIDWIVWSLIVGASESDKGLVFIGLTYVLLSSSGPAVRIKVCGFYLVQLESVKAGECLVDSIWFGQSLGKTQEC